MRVLLTTSVVLLACALLTGCTTGMDYAAATTYQPAHPDDPVPPPVTSSGRSLPPYPTRPISRRASAPRTSPIGEVYAGASVAALPAWGGSLHVGQVFARTDLAAWSLELEATLQDLDSEIGGTTEGGSWAQVRGGAKASFNPCGRGHPTARAGFGWFRSTGETDLVGDADDYIAFHVGLGYEFDITEHLTTGPEITALFAAAEKGFDVKVVPQVRWHVIWKF